jgi:hypothetical protein
MIDKFEKPWTNAKRLIGYLGTINLYVEYPPMRANAARHAMMDANHEYPCKTEIRVISIRSNTSFEERKKERTKEREQNTHLNTFTRDMHVHTPETSYQVHRNKNGTKSSEFRQDVVDLVIRICHLDRNLSQIIRMGPRENLFVVVQVLGHGDQMVLDIG